MKGKGRWAVERGRRAVDVAEVSQMARKLPNTKVQSVGGVSERTRIKWRGGAESSASDINRNGDGGEGALSIHLLRLLGQVVDGSSLVLVHSDPDACSPWPCWLRGAWCSFSLERPIMKCFRFLIPPIGILRWGTVG